MARLKGKLHWDPDLDSLKRHLPIPNSQITEINVAKWRVPFVVNPLVSQGADYSLSLVPRSVSRIFSYTSQISHPDNRIHKKKEKKHFFLFFFEMKDKRNREKRRKILVSVSGLIQPLANKYTVIFRELL